VASRVSGVSSCLHRIKPRCPECREPLTGAMRICEYYMYALKALQASLWV
jgi:hypothetical protein